MYRSIFIFILSTIFVSIVYSQKINSLEFSGGMIRPINAEKGISASFQFNYGLTHNFNLFCNIGYSIWDKNIITF